MKILQSSIAIAMIIFSMEVLIMNYAKSPVWQNRIRLIIVYTITLFSVYFMYITREIWGHITLSTPITIRQPEIILFLVFTLCLEFLLLTSSAAYKKKGFGNLNKILKGGIYIGFILGSVMMLSSWFFNALIFGWTLALLLGYLGYIDEIKKESIPT